MCAEQDVGEISMSETILDKRLSQYSDAVQRLVVLAQIFCINREDFQH